MKMSWASRRMTSRLEVRAYSLLSLFGVNMPLLYGGGCHAFRRLQLETLKISDDESIFACGETEHRMEFHGMFAARPEYFANSGTIARRPFTNERPPYSMTHKTSSYTSHPMQCKERPESSSRRIVPVAKRAPLLPSSCARRKGDLGQGSNAKSSWQSQARTSGRGATVRTRTGRQSMLHSRMGDGTDRRGQLVMNDASNRERVRIHSRPRNENDAIWPRLHQNTRSTPTQGCHLGTIYCDLFPFSQA